MPTANLALVLRQGDDDATAQERRSRLYLWKPLSLRSLQPPNLGPPLRQNMSLVIALGRSISSLLLESTNTSSGPSRGTVIACGLSLPKLWMRCHVGFYVFESRHLCGDTTMRFKSHMIASDRVHRTRLLTALTATTGFKQFLMMFSKQAPAA